MLLKCVNCCKVVKGKPLFTTRGPVHANCVHCMYCEESMAEKPFKTGGTGVSQNKICSAKHDGETVFWHNGCINCLVCKDDIFDLNGQEFDPFVRNGVYYLHQSCTKGIHCRWCNREIYDDYILDTEHNFILHNDSRLSVINGFIKCTLCTGTEHCNICYNQLNGTEKGYHLDMVNHCYHQKQHTRILVHNTCLKQVQIPRENYHVRHTRYGCVNFVPIFFPGWTPKTHRYHSIEVRTSIKRLLLLKKRGGLWCMVDKGVVLLIARYIATPNGWPTLNGINVMLLCTPFQCQWDFKM